MMAKHYTQDPEFQLHVTKLFRQHKGKRILHFDYAGQGFWLKQPDSLKGVWRVLKPNARRTLQREIHYLRLLNERNAPVPQLILSCEDFMVSEDAGRSANLWIEDDNVTPEKKQMILNDCAEALTALHRRGLVHGRPVLRDIAWNDGKVTFLDFEEYSPRGNIQRYQLRDCLIFIHSLFRTRVMSERQEYEAVMRLRETCREDIWQALLMLLHQYRWVYYALLPFRPIAKMDLTAVYKLFENLLPQFEEKTK